MARQPSYDVFLSYRRDGGEMLAKLLHDQLVRQGLRVFLDVESLRSGQFNTKLLDVIAQARDFVLILPPNALDRCQAPDDWVRMEIEHAIKLKKNIVPVMMRGFTWPTNLPASLSTLSLYNGVSASHEYFDAAVGKLINMLQSKPVHKRRLPLGIAAVVLAALLLGALFLSGVLRPAPSYYTFQDAYVETLVRQALNKSEGGITQAELNTITQIPGTDAWDGTVSAEDTLVEASDMDVEYNDSFDPSTLADFAHMPNLERLNLYLLVHVADLSALRGLSNLTVLDLGYVGEDAPFEGLDALSSLTNLTYLNLYNCSLTDISFLQPLTKLELLDLSGNDITDIGPLSGLTALTALVLGGNEISDLSPLEGLSNLEQLNLHGALVSDLSPLAGLTELTAIDLRGNLLTTLDTLPVLPKLVSLYAGENSLSDISQLAEETALQELVLSYNYPLSDISALLSLPNLAHLIYYQYQNFTPFEQLIQLQEQGCSLLLEPAQTEALNRYKSGTYLAQPAPALRADDGADDPDPARYTPHGVAYLSTLSGEVIAAVGNSLSFYQTASQAIAGISVDGAQIAFREMERMAVRHTLSEGVIATVIRADQDPVEVKLPFSYTGTQATLCFITAGGQAKQLNIGQITDIAFDWTQVPDVDLAPYLRITGDGVEASSPLRGIILTYKDGDDYFAKYIFSAELPMTDTLFLSLDSLAAVDFRTQPDSSIRVLYATESGGQETVDTLSQTDGFVQALSGQGLSNIAFSDLIRMDLETAP